MADGHTLAETSQRAPKTLPLGMHAVVVQPRVSSSWPSSVGSQRGCQPLHAGNAPCTLDACCSRLVQVQCRCSSQLSGAGWVSAQSGLGCPGKQEPGGNKQMPTSAVAHRHLCGLPFSLTSPASMSAPWWYGATQLSCMQSITQVICWHLELLSADLSVADVLHEAPAGARPQRWGLRIAVQYHSPVQ